MPFQDELQALKTKVKEVVEENYMLHEQLKRNMVQEILDEGVDIPGVSVTGRQKTKTNKRTCTWNFFHLQWFCKNKNETGVVSEKSVDEGIVI